MTEDALVKKIKEELIEPEELPLELIDRIKAMIRLTRDGKILFLFDRRKISSADLILLYLAGKKLANIAGLIESASAKLDEISKELGLPKGTVAPRLEERRCEGEVVRVERGIYEITSIGIINVVNRVESQLTEK
ncbi:MAG: hypothetical protein DRN49_04210 [Thaumarchaeota archaeon]|nr:MAG: hypothetical protein DRN49_04210 [Nitrososphaerota archaeon]